MGHLRKLTDLERVHFDLAAKRLTARGSTIQVSEAGRWAIQTRFLQVLDRIGREVNGEKLPSVLAELLIACGEAEIIPSDVSSRVNYGLALIAAWLDDHTHALLPTDELRDTLRRLVTKIAVDGEATPSARDFLSQVLAPRTVDRRTGRFVTETEMRVDDPRVFIGSPMTTARNGQLRSVAPTLEQCRQRLEANGIFAFVPALLRDPLHDRQAANAAGLLNVDEAMLALCDLLVLVLAPAAHGVGYLARMAVQLEVPIVLIRGGAQHISTMLTDAVNDVKYIVDGVTKPEEIADELIKFVRSNESQLERVRESRVHRLEVATLAVQRFRAALTSFSRYEWSTLDARIWKLPEDRLRHLQLNPLLFASAVGRDRRAIDYLVPERLSLDADQADALERAEREGEWGPARSQQLRAFVERGMARRVVNERTKFRDDSCDHSWWMDLDDRVD